MVAPRRAGSPGLSRPLRCSVNATDRVGKVVLQVPNGDEARYFLLDGSVDGFADVVVGAGNVPHPGLGDGADERIGPRARVLAKEQRLTFGARRRHVSANAVEVAVVKTSACARC